MIFWVLVAIAATCAAALIFLVGIIVLTLMDNWQ